MANPTQAQIDKFADTNLPAFDLIINGTSSQTVQLDNHTVKTISGYLLDLQAFNHRGAWSSSAVYALKDVVVESSIVYICTVAHTSGTFSTDLAAGKWAIHQLDVTSAISFASDFTVDTNTFKVDATNNRVLIGSVSPISTTVTGIGTLQIQKDAAASLQISTSHTSSSAAISFARSRGTAASPVVVQSGDVVGGVYASAYDGSVWNNTANIEFQISTTPGSGDLPGKIIFRTASDGSSSTTQRMSIDHAGTVAVAAALTAASITISGASSLNTATITGDLTVDTDTLFVDASADAVGINTTTLESSRALTIAGSATIRGSGAGLFFKADTASQNKLGVYMHDTNGNELWRILNDIENNGTNALTIRKGGSSQDVLYFNGLGALTLYTSPNTHDQGIALQPTSGGSTARWVNTGGFTGNVAVDLVSSGRGHGMFLIGQRTSSTDYRNEVWLVNIEDDGTTVNAVQLGSHNGGDIGGVTFAVSSSKLTVVTSSSSTDTSCFGFFQYD